MQDKDFVRDTVERCENAGWRTRLTRKGHLQLIPADRSKRIVIVSGTPSDRSYRKKVEADLRRSGLSEHNGEPKIEEVVEPAIVTATYSRPVKASFPSFGAAVAAARARIGFTVEELAGLLGIDSSQVDDWESSRSTSCSGVILATLQREFDEVRAAPQPDVMDDSDDVEPGGTAGWLQQDDDEEEDTMTTTATFGEALHARRTEEKKTVAAMAATLSLTDRALRGYETDSRAMTQMTYERIVAAVPELRDAPPPRIVPGRRTDTASTTGTAAEAAALGSNASIGVLAKIAAFRRGKADPGVVLELLKAAAEDGLTAHELYEILAA